MLSNKTLSFAKSVSWVFRLQFLLSTSFRRRRFSKITSFIKSRAKTTILDVGGTQLFWYQLGLIDNPKIKITLVNIRKEKIIFNNLVQLQDNALNLGKFTSRQFDIVFSNSLLEHINKLDEQQKVAKQIQRIGKSYVVQTPNKFFPIEPHFLLPFFYLVPKRLQPYYVRYFSLKWSPSRGGLKEIKRHIDSVRLLKLAELKKMFGNANIVKDKFLFLTKSFVVYSKNLKIDK